MPTKIVGHLDADCFYVSAERVRHPHLAGKPVGVLGNQGACVIAKSYELKALGVKTGQPIWEVVPLCPEAIFVKRDFRWYEVLSRKMLAIMQEVSPVVEYYSIDEFFFDAGEVARTFGFELEAACRALQHRILTEVGVPVSMGLSYSRTLAKLASDINKPFGVTLLLDRDEIDDFLATQPASEISGIGTKSAAKLARIGIKSCLDLMLADRHAVQRLLTVKGAAIWHELHGEAVVPIQTVRKQNKRISRGGSLGEKTADADRLIAWLARNTERLVEELDRQRVVCNRIILWLEHKDAPAWIRGIKLPYATASFDVLLAAATALLRTALCGRLVEAMHVDAEGLSVRGREQLSLFGRDEDDRTADVKQAVNGKVGRFALRSAATLPLAQVYGDASNDYDICDVSGKTCF